jgi:hypothetical protein
MKLSSCGCLCLASHLPLLRFGVKTVRRQACLSCVGSARRALSRGGGWALLAPRRIDGKSGHRCGWRIRGNKHIGRSTAATPDGGDALFASRSGVCLFSSVFVSNGADGDAAFVIALVK